MPATAHPPSQPTAARVARMPQGLIGSEILKIAADIRAMMKAGHRICNLTVGDFAPDQFPIPEALRQGISAALAAGETNYPPSNGVVELREAVQAFYRERLQLDYPLDSVLIAGGARPLIYGIYRTVVDPGDRVVYPVPSWNNNHYCHMVGAVDVKVPCRPEDMFLPTREALAKVLPGARLVCINSPLNPTGTTIAEEALRGVCEAIIAENHGRESRGERPLYLMYDHIYWLLCAEGTRHVTPPALVPEMANYTIFVDGVSKAFAATGLRVGFGVGPKDVMERMSVILGHVGAWAPRAEQVACAEFLRDSQGMAKFHETFRRGIFSRLSALHVGLQNLRSSGFKVDSLPPMGAIYLTARFDLLGQRTPEGLVLQSNEEIRKYLLTAAQFAMVPFQAFGVPEDSGWFRLSVGAVSPEEISEALPRLQAALAALQL